MWEWVFEWRSEILTLITWGVSWYGISCLWRKPFWGTFFAGSIIGACVEFMTEPEWNYHMQFYLWRDVSPFVILGWGINFSWVVLLSEKLCKTIFGEKAGGNQEMKLILTDLIVGIPYFLSIELIGLHVLRVWQYNAILQWNTIIPVIQYPLEGVVAIALFSLAFPSGVRYWQRR